MTAFLLVLAFVGMLRLYGRWAGFYRLLTHGAEGSPFDAKRDYDARPMVTFMIPSFNEGKAVCDGIESIMASDWPLDKLEIIAVDDCSHDDTWDWLQVMQKKFSNNVTVWRNEPNKGKSHTLIDIVRKAKGDIVFTVDSDTVVAKQTVREIVSCYADPEMGAVGGFVLCRNLNESIWTQMQGFLFANYYYLTKTLENQFRTARVICGQIASFRRSVFVECIPLIEAREILGVTNIRCAEDSYLTAKICMGDGLEKRWKIFSNFKATAWTNQPATMGGYLKQQLRWWRSQSVGFMVLFKLWGNIKRAGTIPVLITAINATGNITVICLLPFIYLDGELPQLFVTVLLGACVVGIVTANLYNYMIGRHDPVSGKIKNPILAGIWFGAWVIIAWTSLSIFAMFTLDDGGWVTRTKASTPNPVGP